jgi:catechol 2,3-dioxygenase-like lactoylglutathione lyase family enzyme
MKQTFLGTGLFVVGLAGLMSLLQVRSGGSTATPAPASGKYPVLINTCLISKDVRSLAAFYQLVLRIPPKFDGESYAEFRTGAGVLTIFDAQAQEKYIPGSAESSANRSVILEFRVADPNGEYARLQGIVKTWVKPPTTQPWGTRSVYFRDPDGNLVNFFAVAKAK